MNANAEMKDGRKSPTARVLRILIGVIIGTPVAFIAYAEIESHFAPARPDLDPKWNWYVGPKDGRVVTVRLRKEFDDFGHAELRYNGKTVQAIHDSKPETHTIAFNIGDEPSGEIILFGKTIRGIQLFDWSKGLNVTVDAYPLVWTQVK